MTSADATLAIPAQGAIDVLALGAIVHRLDPGVVPFHKATECQIHISGGEFNVAANLANCFAKRTAIATAMVDHPLGEMVTERVRAMGVRPFFKQFANNGVDGPNIATVYSDRGQGIRPPVVFYNRANEAAAMLKAGDFPWETIFSEGVRWFHSGGIFAALSASNPDLIIEGMQAAKAAGAVVSFDLNFRNLLWSHSGGLDTAQQTLRRIVEHVDVLAYDRFVEDLRGDLVEPRVFEQRGVERGRTPHQCDPSAVRPTLAVSGVDLVEGGLGLTIDHGDLFGRKQLPENEETELVEEGPVFVANVEGSRHRKLL